MLKINKGKQNRALKVVIYAGEGVGKTTLASKFPEPLFIDTEDGTFNLDVARVDKPNTWAELLSIIKLVKEEKPCKTLVIDTIDWAEQLAIKEICEKHRVPSIESINYGKGYVYVADSFTTLLEALNGLINEGMNVVLTAHAKPRKFELPEELGQYDRYEMKLTRQVCPLIKEWCDMLLFCNYKTFVVTTENNTKKAQGGKRVMYTTHNPCWDAKNRFGLPEELELSFDPIASLFCEHGLTQAEIKPTEAKERTNITKLKEMISAAGITEEDVQKVVAERGHYALDAGIETYSDDFITRWVVPNWKKIVDAIKSNKNKGDK